MLNMTDQLQFDVISGSTLENWSDYWSDSLYEEVGYLRMRYLHKVIRLQGHLSVDIDEVSE
ncbi:hypothetical protein F444_04580 [Phytophthora nicotianae P1976]|uniref:Uncharacterized protein n=1 Tax=Phytophthora nicotianae P1976 TaxID=1317066 RepID=A0A081AQ82_PHYNI|nr:hypothetical protein F444_04580 [Phytophthora nicotianae P1976]